MNYNKAFKLMTNGYKVKRIYQDEYWTWDTFHKDIIIHRKKGSAISLSNTNLAEFKKALSDTQQSDWEIMIDDLSFFEAIKLLERDKVIARRKKPSIIFYMGEEGVIKEQTPETKGTKQLAYDAVFGLDDIQADDWYEVIMEFRKEE